MTLIWGRRARRDLHELIAYIAEDSVQTAELVATRIRNAAELLSKMPRAGRPGRVNRTCELVVSRPPYILVYRSRCRGRNRPARLSWCAPVAFEV